MEGVLNQVIGSQKETKVILKAQTNALTKILAVQEDILHEEKQRNKQAKRDKQSQKRKDADTKKKDGILSKILSKKGDDKKKGGGFLGGILKSIMGGVGGALALKAAIAGLVGIAGAAITAYFASPEFREIVNTFASDLFTTIKESYTKAVVMGGGKIADTGGDLINKVLYGTETTDRTKSLQNERGQAQAELAIASGPGSEVDAEEIKRLGEKVSRMQDLVKSSVDIEKSEAAIKRLEALREETFIDIDGKRKSMAGPAVEANIKKEKERLEAFKKTMAELVELEEEYKQRHIEYLKATDPNFDPELYQSGGFVGTVPNQGGNGDRFKTMVKPGSVVMNQNAAGMFQSGGLVPVMLEQREIVVPPGPNAGAALMMNSMFPRFQSGGVVATDGVSDTGSGYQPNDQKDYKGRPVVFSKAAAEAWASFGNNVRGQDVNSSKRSPSYNAMVGGVSNSNHLYGTGVDVQTGSPSWHFLKENDGKAGWKFNNYLGPQGWHWDFKGAGMTITPKEGNEDGIAKMSSREPDFLGQFMSSMTPGAQAMGTGAKELLDAFSPILQPLMETFGDFASLALGGFSNLLGLGQQQNSFIGPQDYFADNAASAGGQMGSSGGQAGGAQTASQLYKQMGFTSAQWDLYRNTVAQIESGGKYNIAGGSNGHYDGRYQLGAAAKTDGARYAGIADPGHGPASRDAFRKDAKLQEQLFTGFTMANYKYLMSNSQFADASKERQLQILGYAHNQGMGGAEKWMTTGEVGRDGFGTKGTAYTNAIAAEFKKTQGLQTGGVAQMRGASSMGTKTMVAKSQEQFAKQIAQAVQPTVVPIPMGGGGGSKVDNSETAGTPFPNLPAEDNSVVSMEYKYRITMGASV